MKFAVPFVLLLAMTGCRPAAIGPSQDGSDLRESADGIPEIDVSKITEQDIGKTVVIKGKVRTRTFDGWEGKQLLDGNKVMARMAISLQLDQKTKTTCTFRPTNRKELLPEIETVIRVIGVVKSVNDYTKWDEKTRLSTGAEDEKFVFLEDCRFAR